MDQEYLPETRRETIRGGSTPASMRVTVSGRDSRSKAWSLTEPQKQAIYKYPDIQTLKPVEYAPRLTLTGFLTERANRTIG